MLNLMNGVEVVEGKCGGQGKKSCSVQFAAFGDPGVEMRKGPELGPMLTLASRVSQIGR